MHCLWKNIADSTGEHLPICRAGTICVLPALLFTYQSIHGLEETMFKDFTTLKLFGI